MNLIKRKSSTIIMLGFTVVMLLLVALSAKSVIDFRATESILSGLTIELQEVKAVSEMRDVAHQRAMLLQRMVGANDAFEREEIYQEYLHVAERYLKAREIFNVDHMNEKEARVWRDVVKFVNQNAEVQNKTADLILNEASQEARDQLGSSVAPLRTRQFLHYQPCLMLKG